MPISKPATGNRGGPQEKPQGGVFLGGALSAILLSLCFFDHDDTLERTIPWFGLLPLFISIARHRHNLKWRVIHGLIFGLILSCWQLETTKRGFFAPSAAFFRTVVALLLMTGSWVLFCAAGGLLLRHPSRLAVMPGLAVVWTGIEFLRTEGIPLAMPWLQLGQALKPANPEAKAAAVIGLAGLGFVICLVNSAFFLALKEKSGKVQFLCALSGTLAVIGLWGTGSGYADHPLSETTTRIGLVQTEEGENRNHIHLARQLSGSRPELILFPGDGFMVAADRQAWLEEDLRSFARTENVPVIAGVVNKAGSDEEQDSGNESTIIHIGRNGSVMARLKRGEADGESRLLEIAAGKIALVRDRVGHSSIQMRSLAARGARLFLIAGDSETSDQGIYGHLRTRLQAFRAMETGTWICRATRGGVSSIYSDRGYLMAQAPQGLAWATVTSVPLRPQKIGPSPYASWGWYLGPGCLLLTILLPIAQRYRRRKNA